MLFNLVVDDQQSLGRAALFGHHPGTAISFFVQLHVSMHLGADGGQYVLNDGMVGVEQSSTGDRWSGGKEVFYRRAMTWPDGRYDKRVVV